MPRRYSRSGWNDEALTDAATDARNLLNNSTGGDTGITTGRVFYLRGLSISNEHATNQGVLELWDVAAEGVPGATTQRGNWIIPANYSVLLDFPSPGIQFKNGILGTISAGTVAIASVLVWGYEEEAES